MKKSLVIVIEFISLLVLSRLGISQRLSIKKDICHDLEAEDKSEVSLLGVNEQVHVCETSWRS